MPPLWACAGPRLRTSPGPDIVAATCSTPAQLDAFVSRCLEASAALPGAAAADLLRRNASRVAQQIRVLAAWTGRAQGRQLPAHLQGLSAFDLIDAMESLEAEAIRRRPDGWGEDSAP